MSLSGSGGNRLVRGRVDGKRSKRMDLGRVIGTGWAVEVEVSCRMVDTDVI